MSVEQPTLTQEQKNEITDYINMYRAKHSAPPITYDDNIAVFSQNWATYLASTGLFEHSTNREYGENLAYFRGYGNKMMELIKKSIDLWYEEISLYDYENPGFSSETGHFTCLIWKNQTSFGMGYAYNPATDVVNVNQNVSPSCNIMGGFEENVLPLKEETPSVPIVEEPDDTPSNGNGIVIIEDPPTDETPTDETPTDETPTDETPTDETPTEEPKKNIIYLIENLLYLIRAGYRRRVILQSLNIIINELLMNKENIEPSKLEEVNRLYYAKYLLESGKSLYYVFQTVLSIFYMLKRG